MNSRYCTTFCATYDDTQCMFQNKFGNMHQKAQRMTDISNGLANLSNNADVQQAYRAGLLARSDLIYEMVYGFSILKE